MRAPHRQHGKHAKYSHPIMIYLRKL